MIDLRPDHLAAIKTVLAAHVPQEEVWAFGSRVTWTAKDQSDLDLTILGNSKLDNRTLIRLALAFEESDLPFRVDVVDWNAISEEFRSIILKKYEVLQKGSFESKEDISAAQKGKTVSFLEDCMEAIIDYRGKTPRKTTFGIPLITARVVKNGKIEPPNEFIAEKDYASWMRRGLPKPGDVVLTTEAPLGEVAQLGDERVALAQRLIALRGKNGFLDNTYLKYLLRSENIQEQLRSRSSGTTVLGIKQSELRRVLLPIPPLEEQYGIANVLGKLDDKIELNRKMNKTLEAMARALFKSWFVDFDPVRAKSEGRDTGLPKKIADFFPSEFESTDMGEIPKGWEVGSFADTVEIIGGGTPKTSELNYWNGDIPWFSVVDAPWETNIWVIGTEKKITKEGLENSSTRVLPVGTTIISARGTVGSVGLVGVPMAMNQSCYGLCGKAGNYGYHTYFSTRYLVSELRQHAHGSVFDTITRDTFEGINVVIPSNAVIELFEDKLNPFMSHVLRGVIESRDLVIIRETLLPKLISGKLRVPVGRNI